MSFHCFNGSHLHCTEIVDFSTVCLCSPIGVASLWMLLAVSHPPILAVQLLHSIKDRDYQHSNSCRFAEPKGGKGFCLMVYNQNLRFMRRRKERCSEKYIMFHYISVCLVRTDTIMTIMTTSK